MKILLAAALCAILVAAFALGVRVGERTNDGAARAVQNGRPSESRVTPETVSSGAEAFDLRYIANLPEQWTFVGLQPDKQEAPKGGSSVRPLVRLRYNGPKPDQYLMLMESLDKLPAEGADGVVKFVAIGGTPAMIYTNSGRPGSVSITWHRSGLNLRISSAGGVELSTLLDMADSVQ